MSRPVKYPPELVAERLAQAEGDVCAAARSLGCNPSTIYLQRAKYPVVEEAFQMHRPTMLAYATSGITAILKNPDHPKHYDCCKFVAETQGKHDGFTTRQEMDVTTKDESVNREWTIVDAPPPDADE